MAIPTAINPASRGGAPAAFDAVCPPEPGAWIAALLQTSDTFYPTGSYAHSFGLEGLVQAGHVRDLTTLRAFLLEQALPALARTDLAISVQLWGLLSEPAQAAPVAGGAPISAEAAPGKDPDGRPEPDWLRIGQYCHLAHALRGAREPREAAAAIGRQRCELAGRLRGGIAAEFHSRAVAGGWPEPTCAAAVIEARAFGAPLEAALAAQVYATSASLLAAAVKLLRLGQNSVQALLTECLAGTPNYVQAAGRYATSMIGAFNPWWDIAASHHETAEFRLFIS